jgi:hypothetical protein
MNRLLTVTALLVLLLPARPADGETLDGRLHHLRSGKTREWSEFPAVAESDRLELNFQAAKNAAAVTLVLRQRDVKMAWRVELNKKRLGQLVRDENDQLIRFTVPPGALQDGANQLRIIPSAQHGDDILVGEIRLEPRAPAVFLHEAKVHIRVLDSDSGKPLPCRLTIAASSGALALLGAESNERLAVRTGVIYTANGDAGFGLESGEYTIWAGRGFEYGISKAVIKMRPGDRISRTLKIRREVPTPGLVSCDTHIHTVTHSGHGDCDMPERMITIAGEGIELPIATDHNKHIDYVPTARELGLLRHFTPVIGNEVTTRHGHFNIFPIAAGIKPPGHTPEDWKTIFGNIRGASDGKPQVVILNHPRDVHAGYRPLGPLHHNEAVGRNLDGELLEANAIEIINSAALHSNPLRVFRDWMTLLNSGLRLTPVGSSDSHEVSTKIVGQGRTYIACDDSDPGKIDVAGAVEALLAGRVSVCLGLLATITVDGRHGPGALASPGAELQVEVEVLGPSWSHPGKVRLFSNGLVIREADISEAAALRPGSKWKRTWVIPRPPHDVHLVAAVTGKSEAFPFHPIARTYQPVTPDWEPYIFGSSGAVWVDGDGDGKPTSARRQAAWIADSVEDSLDAVIGKLASCDEAVAAQAASVLDDRGVDIESAKARRRIEDGSEAVRLGFRSYLEAKRLSSAALEAADAGEK